MLTGLEGLLDKSGDTKTTYAEFMAKNKHVVHQDRVKKYWAIRQALTKTGMDGNTNTYYAYINMNAGFVINIGDLFLIGPHISVLEYWFLIPNTLLLFLLLDIWSRYKDFWRID
jgi:hypothetical protein